MEEERKSLRESLEELTKKLENIEEKKKERKNILKNIPVLGWILSPIFGGLIFFLVWVFVKDIFIASASGGFALILGLFISVAFNMFPPFTARRLGKGKKRKGYVVFMNIGLNRAVSFIKAPLDEGVAMVNGTPHTITADDILIWKNKIPIVIQPQWSEKPFSAKTHQELVKERNEESTGWRTLMNYMYKNQIQPEKKGIKMGAIVLGVLIVLGLGYYLIKGGF